MSTATCEIRFSLQNHYAADSLVRALADLAISNRAVTISGRATMSEKFISKEAFLDAGPEDIRATLRRFLANNALPRANDFVILDMEPSGFAPRNLGEFNEKAQRRLIAAYSLRIRVARQELRRTGLPGLKLGLYQVIVPDGKGRPSEGFLERMGGYVAAGRQGMYDQLDFICPVLYQRFGANDARPETLRRWISAATRQAITQSLTLARRNGRRVPLVPILSFWVFNGRSESNRRAVSPASVARQLRIVQRGDGIDAIVFWSGSQTEREMAAAKEPVEPIAIDRFLVATGVLPWPGCA